MKKPQIPFIYIVFASLFILSIILRFYQLDKPLLDDKEAITALASIGSSSEITSGNLTSLGLAAIIRPVLSVFGKNEITARLIPAILGSLIVLLPFLFKKYLKKEQVYILSILFIFDPGLVASSRQVNGAIISIAALLISIGFLINKKVILAGIALGIALLGSPVIWPGILALVFPLWISGLEKVNSGDEGNLTVTLSCLIDKKDFIPGMIALAATWVIVGSAFFTFMEGITAPIINLVQYLQGWSVSNGFPFFLFLFSLILYQPFAIVFGLYEGIRAKKSDSPAERFLLRWFLISVLLAVVYPSKTMDSLLISTIPLLTLFALFISRVWNSMEKPDIPAWGLSGLVILLVVFSWMNVIVLRFPIEGQEETLRAAATVGGLVLLAMSALLIRFGWPPRQTETGLFLGFALLACVFMFSSAWRAAGLGKYPQAELWRYDGEVDQLDLLKQTAGDLSEWSFLSREGIDITLVNYPSPAIQWAMRDFSKFQSDRYLPVSSNPSIAITTAEDVPALAEAYRGQDFVLVRKTAWSLILPEEWIQWLAFREVPEEKQQVILWARTDLFPGSQNIVPAALLQPQ